jgi:hypothetical protein
MHMKSTLPLLLSLLLLTLISACRKDEQVISSKSGSTAQVPTQWYDLSINLSKETPGFTPPVAARAYGYVGVALYEAIAQSQSTATSLQGQISGFTIGTVPRIITGVEYDWDIVANAVLAHSLRKYYKNTSPTNWALINQLDTDIHNQFAGKVVADIAQRSRDFGLQVADAVHAYSMTDGQDECYLSNFPASYTPPTGPGMWVPTAPAFQPALQPYWGDVRPFLGNNVLPVQPPGPPTYSEQAGSQFYLEGLEVYTVTQHLTQAQKTIAEYWSDDPGKTATPPGHSISILNQIVKIENPTLLEAAEMYARMGMALHDAFVSCWKTKYLTNVLRPITYIRNLFDPNFTTLLNTPPFPEYTSGHSVQSGSSCTVLAYFFGENYAFTDRTHQNRTDIDGSPRHFTSFSQIANEAAISRLYGGIHYVAAIDHGVEQGRKIGANITQLKMLLK